jgi:hypothetical protein
LDMSLAPSLTKTAKPSHSRACKGVMVVKVVHGEWIMLFL